MLRAEWKASWSAPWILLLVLGAALVTHGCSGGRRSSDKEGGRGTRTDAGPRADGDSSGSDAGYEPINPCAPACGPEELCGEGDGNGLDDDCDGEVDEDCHCAAPNITRPCFAGPPDRRNVGACSDGIMACDEFLNWGPCVGGTSPSEESCDGQDNDCNAQTDDLPGCDSAVECPGNEYTSPLSTYRLRGGRVYGGEAQSWSWRVECPDSVPDALCPPLDDPFAKDPSVYFTASGAYRVFVEVVTEEGERANCSWTVYVAGQGLRVELNWDTMLDTEGGTDVDLHLHRWTTNDAESGWFTGDDCYYNNCVPRTSSFGEINWPDHEPSDLSKCESAPHGGGETWQDRGSCRNPRLDVDTNGVDGACDGDQTDPNERDFCAPENINVDNPIMGMPYRIMVNYFNNNFYEARTNVSVNIYCGGALRASFGADPFVWLYNGDLTGAANDNWLVADVVFKTGTCGTECMVYPIGTVERGDYDGYPFGPAWSCDYDEEASACIE